MIALGGIVIAAVIFPPAGYVLAAAYGSLEVYLAVEGRDWYSERDLERGERWFRGT